MRLSISLLWVLKGINTGQRTFLSHLLVHPDITSAYFPSPALFTPPAILFAPSSTDVDASANPFATGRPALPVAPSNVSPTPLPNAPTTPPTVFVTPPTVLPTVEVTNLTPDVTPDSCWPMGIVDVSVGFVKLSRLEACMGSDLYVSSVCGLGLCS